MFIKYIIKTQERPIGLKYDSYNSILVIGGHALLESDINSILNDYFKVDKENVIIENQLLCGNRFKLVIKPVNKDDFQAGINLLKDHAISTSMVNTLGRIIR